jgi:hypothetical protein
MYVLISDLNRPESTPHVVPYFSFLRAPYLCSRPIKFCLLFLFLRLGEKAQSARDSCCSSVIMHTTLSHASGNPSRFID